MLNVHVEPFVINDWSFLLVSLLVLTEVLIFGVRAMSPGNFDTILSCDSMQLVFWHLWEDSCQYHSPGITKAAIIQ